MEDEAKLLGVAAKFLLVGDVYQHGYGRNGPNLTKARQWWEKAAASKDTEASVPSTTPNHTHDIIMHC